MKSQLSKNSKNTMHIVAYLSIIGLVVAFVLYKRENNLARYHIRQSIGISLLAYFLLAISVIPYIGGIIAIFGSVILLYMWAIGLLNAIYKKEKPIPLFGRKFNIMFKNL